MKTATIMFVFAAALSAGTCDSEPTGNRARMDVRFVNAIPGLGSDVGFMANHAFVSGSVVPFPGTSATCSRINPGSATVTLAFGTINAARTELSGPPLESGEYIRDPGGNYALIAHGTPDQPKLGFYSNATGVTPSANQAAVRFLALVPSTGYDIFVGTNTNQPDARTFYDQASLFILVSAGVNSFRFRDGTGTDVAVPSNTFNLPAGSYSNIALFPSGNGDFQLMLISVC
jgi:hypothetical protein